MKLLSNKTTHAVAALLAAAFLFLALPAAAFAQEGETPATPAAPAPKSEPVILSYRLLSPQGAPVSRAVKGDSISVELLVKNTGLSFQALEGLASNVDASKLVDSFSGGGAATVAIESLGSDPLLLRITIPGCVYTGAGRSFKLMVGYRNLSLPYDQLELSVTECVEYTSPAPTQAPSVAIPSPMVQIARSNLNEPIKAGEQFALNLSFTNIGQTTMEQAMATIVPSEALVLMENASTFPLGGIAPGRTAVITLHFKATKEIASEVQSISAEVRFNYFNGETSQQGTATDKLTIPAKATNKDGTQPMDGPVPNVILKKYDFGANQIAAGALFDLSLEFMNTSSRNKVENLVMTVDPGEGVAIRSSSNTFFYAKLGKEEGLSETIGLQALPGAKPGVVELNVTFKYEYVDNNKRSQATVSQKISIPVFQPDRFEVKAPSLPATAAAGEEVALSLSYVNKGKSEVANVQAELTGQVNALATVQNLGNFESGKSGSINFVILPQEPGLLSFGIKVTYEDASGALQTKEFPLSLTVEEPAIQEPDFPIEGEESGAGENPGEKKTLWLILGGAGLAVAAGGITLLSIRKRKAAKKKKSYAWDDGDAV